MSKRTNKYQLLYFEQDDVTDSATELQRWETLDAQMFALFNVIGNGIREGWEITSSDGLDISISPGQGHVGFVSVKSESSSTISNLLPNSDHYIYAEITEDSYWNQTVAFSAYLTAFSDNENVLYLGSITTDATSVSDIDSSGRSYLGFTDIIDEAVKTHRHIGGENNPDPIDLSSEVQGVLNQNNIPSLDASKILTGELDEERIPEIDHINGLYNNGSLTHNQIDSFIDVLDMQNNKTMGEVSTVNLLQLTLALKHAYPDIDEYLVNQISFIPGISPDDYVDMENTSADVDYRTYQDGGTHTITMSPGLGLNAYTQIWDSKDDFEGSEQNNVFVNSDLICLSTNSLKVTLDDFNELDDWEVFTENLSTTSSANLQLDDTNSVGSENSNSAKLSISINENDMSLVLRKTFDSQDWSSFNYLTFYIKTDSVEHGDWIFYLSDSENGVQNSYRVILDRNTPTINVDTLENGWQEIVVDLRVFFRASINEIALYTSTLIGWDNSKGFDLNIDSFSLSTSSVYEDNGYIRFIYENGFPTNFWRLRWDTIFPSDSDSIGVGFQVRFRLANTSGGLSVAEWSDYYTLSGQEINVLDELYKYIEIECYFESSDNNKRSVCLKKFYLDFYVNENDSKFSFASQEDWESGSLFNIDSSSSPGEIKISGIDDIGNYYFASEGYVGQLSSSLEEKFSFNGSSLPKSTNQHVNDISSSLGYISGISRGDNGSLWLADTDNDRILKVDKYGNLIIGFYGSFIDVPDDPYGIEENGPGSNEEEILESSVSTETADSSNVNNENVSVLLNVIHSIYNNNSGELYIIYDDYLENIYDTQSNLNKDKIYLKVGSHRFNLSESYFELLGISEEKYDIWGDFSGAEIDGVDLSKFINQFSFNSHVLKVTILGADKTALDETLVSGNPSLSISYPFQNYKTSDSSIKIIFSLRNVILGSSDGEYGIKLYLDSDAPITIYEDNYEFTGLLSGSHLLNFTLVDSDGIEVTNSEASSSLNFNILSSYSDPYLSIQNPKPNQIYSSNSLKVDFLSENFPIIPTGQHLQYQIDSEFPVDHYSSGPIVLEDLEPGNHTIRLFFVDQDGEYLSYTYGDISSSFIIGLNPNSTMTLYSEGKGIYSKSGNPSSRSRVMVDISNIYFRNIYSPIDIQMIANDQSGLSNGNVSLLVSKLRSKSWLGGSANEESATELATRLENIARAAAGEDLLQTNQDLSEKSNIQLIFGTNYLDGHSVVQLDSLGETFFSNNAARFANNKEQAKMILGSAEKIGPSELLIADSIRKRAIITYTNLESEKSIIEWQYDSDRYIPDFHIVPQEERVIDIFDDSISESSVYIRRGTTIVWRNSSSSPITIYSGSTNYDLFQQDPDLNLYGNNFTSSVINPGDSYSFNFITGGEFDWFTYPDILTGEIVVTNQRISSRDLYYLLESDGLESPFTSRLIKVDSWGNLLFSFGEGLIVKPRDVRPMLNGNVLLST
jgi:hypothetical protein